MWSLVTKYNIKLVFLLKSHDSSPVLRPVGLQEAAQEMRSGLLSAFGKCINDGNKDELKIR